ncbi:MAG: hypothetical protein EOO51_02525 [Flavobacterium sp.]|nr:MAG: hypothetical protein EOO51_02525 [Flavobacterium sp.]
MNLKMKFVLSLFCLAAACAAQDRSFLFSQVQSRNDAQEWSQATDVGRQVAHFTQAKIELTVDRDYWLTIIRKTELPGHGMVYLCRDQYQKPVTVTLFDDEKMLLYNENRRFQIRFEHPIAMARLKDSYADAD